MQKLKRDHVQSCCFAYQTYCFVEVLVAVLSLDIRGHHVDAYARWKIIVHPGNYWKYCWMITDCIINWLHKIDSSSDRFNCFAPGVRFRSAVILFHSCQELLWQITLLKWKYCNNEPACESPASTTGTYGTGQIFDRLTSLGVSTLTMRKFRRLAVQSFV